MCVHNFGEEPLKGSNIFSFSFLLAGMLPVIVLLEHMVSLASQQQDRRTWSLTAGCTTPVTHWPSPRKTPIY